MTIANIAENKGIQIAFFFSISCQVHDEVFFGLSLNTPMPELNVLLKKKDHSRCCRFGCKSSQLFVVGNVVRVSFVMFVRSFSLGDRSSQRCVRHRMLARKPLLRRASTSSSTWWRCRC
jgi:hypothetical protein